METYTCSNKYLSSFYCATHTHSTEHLSCVSDVNLIYKDVRISEIRF